MEEPEVRIRKKRALTSERARDVRAAGHKDALDFALAIGLSHDYQNDAQAKKDVIDLSGDAHSVKSGEKKWQIFLYRLSRFLDDDGFRVMNGVGELLIACIQAFPENFDVYQANKLQSKERLRDPMRQLTQKFRDKVTLRAFLNKSIFNAGEVGYLTVKQGGVFYVFLGKDVVKVMSENLEVENSKARKAGDVPEQKVLFRYKGRNLGELEMRNDTPTHYREIRFNMIKPRVMELLFEKIPMSANYSERVTIYGNASRRFGRWFSA